MDILTIGELEAAWATMPKDTRIMIRDIGLGELYAKSFFRGTDYDNGETVQVIVLQSQPPRKA